VARQGGAGELTPAWRAPNGSPYDVKTGERVYRSRVSPSAGGFSASPVAAGGRIYLAGEDGDIFVVKAGRAFELLATNPMGEINMATPAISGNMLILRTQGHLLAIAQG
jgi:outer membrane protein assembly factor BamB